jgi:hypothetical protein
MNKIVLTLAFIISVVSSHSQIIGKSQKILGGTIGLGYSNNKSDTSIANGGSFAGDNFYILLSPSFGAAVKNNLVLGYRATLGLDYSKTEDKLNSMVGKTNGYQLGIGVFVERFYPLRGGFSLSVTPDLGVSYNYFEDEVFYNSNLDSKGTTNLHTVGLQIFPSLNYSFNERFLIQFSLNDFIGIAYRWNSTEVTSSNVTPKKQTSSEFYFNTVFNYSRQLSNISFAFRYIFPRRS